MIVNCKYSTGPFAFPHSSSPYLHLPFSLKAIRAKVWAARQESPLFNVKTYTQNLEKLFFQMWKTFLHNDTPQHLTDWR